MAHKVLLIKGCVSSSQFDGGALFDVSATEKEEILEFDISELVRYLLRGILLLVYPF